jgi:hypothetical protein
MFEKQNTPNISKPLKIIKKQLQSPPSFKNNHALIPCWKLTTGQSKNKKDKNNDLQQALHPNVGSHRCCYKPAIHIQALAISCITGEHPIQMLPTLKIYVETHAPHTNVTYPKNICRDTCTRQSFHGDVTFPYLKWIVACIEIFHTKLN